MSKYLLLATLLVLSSCKSKTNSHTQDVVPLSEDYGAYILSHTQPVVSIKDALTVKFTRDVVAESEIGSDVSKELYRLSKSIKGHATWKDQSTFVFRPTMYLQYDDAITLDIFLHKLFDDIPDAQKVATIPFKTDPLKLKIVINNIVYDGKNLQQKGRLTSSDYISDSEAESMLQVSQDGKSLDLEWSHNSTIHEFEIIGAVRGVGASQLLIEWKDNSYDTNFRGKWNQDIVPIGTFSTANIETGEDDSRAITISFTETLDQTQSLDGLITIKDYGGKLKYDMFGSQIKVYPQSKVVSPFELNINAAIQSQSGAILNGAITKNLSFGQVKPGVKLSGKGVIVPYNEEIIFPFSAVNLDAVTVEVFKIFEDNVLQFLQYNRLNTTYGMHPVGRIIHQEKVNLSSVNSAPNDSEHVRYALDLRNMITPDPGAIYQIRIGFDQEDVSNYTCTDQQLNQVLVERDGFTSIMRNNSNYEGYQWEDRENPCKPAYYNQSKFIIRNVLASNIGIIAKESLNNSILLAISDLRTVEPISGAEIEFYDFQQQKIGKSITSSDGQSTTTLERDAAFAIVRSGSEFGYIDLQDPLANSLSNFDVSGKRKKKGLDGYLYGERGVWRPGDTLFLNFMLEDKLQKLDINHPITMTVDDAKGKEKYKKTTSSHLDHVYHFAIPTSSGDPTGNWTATVRVGGATFVKNLKVETVKPNRLKIEYDINDQQSIALYDNERIGLSSKWLHGATADGLRAKVDLQITSLPVKFDKYLDYKFQDPARKVEPVPTTLFDDALDENGRGAFTIEDKEGWLPPGKLKINLKTKVFEKGGNFSEDNFSVPADLYRIYVGIRIPKTRWGSNFIKNNQKTGIPIVALDTDGKPIANRKLKVGIYQANWRWWYDRNYSDRYNYNSMNHNGALIKDEITTDASGQASYEVNFDDYGNYMIRVCDSESGHCTGDLFYTGRSWSRRSSEDGPQQLSFQTDKTLYEVGEEIEVKLPTNLGSKVFLSIENGSEVLQSFWVDGQKEETTVNIPTDASMNANVYIHAHLIQPHNNGQNDLPMRMYGVVPVSVIDGSSQIHPEIVMAESLKPNEKYTINISESDGKPMTYTIAVVDEGLLDLTRFKTPDPWNQFYGKQALGVKTWDIYDYVLDGYGGALDRYISVGGDAAGINNKKGKKANRFKAVVKHLGPFTLPAKGNHSHEVMMPNYVGSVKTMVVARHADAYGKTEKTVAVKKPLMVLATVPRVLGPSETLALPSNVFAMEDNIKNVNVSVETTGNISIDGSKSQQLSFAKMGDQQAYFEMTVGKETGIANIKMTASGHGQSSTENVEVNIRNPNPYTSEVYEGAIKPGEDWTLEYETFGTLGSNEALLELSTIPPMDFGRRLKYLIRYPYGCVEQTTSSVFPQLYLSAVTELPSSRLLKIDQNIQAGINRLSKFQTASGGLAYWPGNRETNEWGTNYAGHFLIEAKDKGYAVPDQLLKGLLKYQDQEANQFNLSTAIASQIKTQAHRLYMLARASRPNIGAMNRLRKTDKLDVTSAHLLAASYAIMGKKEIAAQLIANKDTEIKPYVETGYTYGSHVRDLAIIAQAQQIMGNENETGVLIKQISDRMRSGQWYSTQTTAYALMSIGKYLESYESDDIRYELTHNQASTDIGQSSKPSVQKTIAPNEDRKNTLSIKNTSKALLYVKHVVSGQLPPGSSEEAYNRHIKLDVTYLDQDGKVIDPSSIKQGKDFRAVVSIRNLGSRGSKIKELALSQIFASGWEIQNERMSAISTNSGDSPYDFKDIRDDRVYTFFDMNERNRNQTYTVNLTAAYAGKFYLSPVSVEAMYDNEIQAKTKGQWVEVVR